MSYYKCIKLYSNLFNICFPPSLVFGVSAGICSVYDDPKPFNVFTSLIGYTSLGIITGITFPISYPLFTGYVVYKHIKNTTNTTNTK